MPFGQPLRWGCGLKSLSTACRNPCDWSASAMGLWIEIMVLCGTRCVLLSASAMGLWIEIICACWFIWHQRVSLCDGAVDWNPDNTVASGYISMSASAMGLWIEISVKYTNLNICSTSASAVELWIDIVYGQTAISHYRVSLCHDTISENIAIHGRLITRSIIKQNHDW